MTFSFAELLLSVLIWLIGGAFWLLWAGYASLRLIWKIARNIVRVVAYLFGRLTPTIPARPFAAEVA